LRRLLCLLAVLAVSPPLRAQDAYPSGTVKLVVGFAPGGGNDILARIVADKLQHYGIQNGQLRALAVTTAARIPSLPDIPAVAEAALPGFEW